MNVSLRSVQRAARLQRLRPDLSDRVMAGELSTDGALRIAEARQPDPDANLAALCKAWARCSEDDRAAFMEAIAYG